MIISYYAKQAIKITTIISNTPIICEHDRQKTQPAYTALPVQEEKLRRSDLTASG